MVSKIIIDLILIGCLVTCIGLLIYIGVVAKSEAGQCYRDPLKYVARKLSEANKASFSATGRFDSSALPFVYFDSNNVTIYFEKQPYEQKEVDFGKLINFSLS